MEVVSFIIVVIIGLIVYFFLQKKQSLEDTGRNYYYKRFMRNKLQMQKIIDEVESIVSTSTDFDYSVLVNKKINLKEYLEDLKVYYEEQFCEKKIKKIKNKSMTFKDKSKYVKILQDQSEKLYKIEIDLASFQKTEKYVNYI